MNPRLLLVSTLALAALTGCPDEAKTGKTAVTQEQKTPAKTGDGDDPLKGSLFSKQDLFAIYAAEMKRDSDPAFRRKVLTEHKLLDASGKPNQARTEAYDRALKRFAEKAPEEWSAFVESLGEPKKTGPKKTG